MKYDEPFPSDFDYLCEKLPEYVGDEKNFDFGKARIRATQVLKHLTEFRKLLTSDSHGGMLSTTDQVIYALNRFEQFCDSPNTSRLSSKDACIFAAYIEFMAKRIHHDAKML